MSRRRGLIGAARAYLYEENAEFYKRKTGGTQSVGSGIAAIREIRGKSIVWNQVLQNGNFIDTTSWSFGNTIVPTFLEGGGVKCTINTKEVYNQIAQYLNAAIPRGHKVLLRILHKTPSGVEIYLIGDPNYVIWREIHGQGNTEYEVAAFINTPSKDWNRVEIRINTQSVSSTPVDVYLSNFQVIDLTLMFGAGNEPATVAEFEKMFPLDYYDYNKGEVIPFAGQNLVTIGKNQYNHTTGKANLLGSQTYQLLGTYTSATIDGVAVTLDSNNCFTTTKDCVLDITGGNDTDTIVALYNGSVTTYAPYESHTLSLNPSQWRDTNDNLVFPYGGMHGVGSLYDYAKVDADGYIRRAVRVYERRAYESGDVTGGNIITDGTTYTIYPLVTPIEVELATPVYAKYLEDKDGTEEITPANSSTPYTTTANLSILYPLK